MATYTEKTSSQISTVLGSVIVQLSKTSGTINDLIGFHGNAIASENKVNGDPIGNVPQT